MNILASIRPNLLIQSSTSTRNCLLFAIALSGVTIARASNVANEPTVNEMRPLDSYDVATSGANGLMPQVIWVALLLALFLPLAEALPQWVEDVVNYLLGSVSGTVGFTLVSVSGISFCAFKCTFKPRKIGQKEDDTKNSDSSGTSQAKGSLPRTVESWLQERVNYKKDERIPYLPYSPQLENSSISNSSRFSADEDSSQIWEKQGTTRYVGDSHSDPEEDSPQTPIVQQPAYDPHQLYFTSRLFGPADPLASIVSQQERSYSRPRVSSKSNQNEAKPKFLQKVKNLLPKKPQNSLRKSSFYEE